MTKNMQSVIGKQKYKSFLFSFDLLHNLDKKESIERKHVTVIEANFH